MKTLDTFIDEAIEEGFIDRLIYRGKQKQAIGQAQEHRRAERHYRSERERAEKMSQKIRFDPREEAKGTAMGKIKGQVFKAAVNKQQSMGSLESQHRRAGDKSIDQAWHYRAKRRES